MQSASAEFGPECSRAVVFDVGGLGKAGKSACHVIGNKWKIELGLMLLNESVFCGFEVLVRNVGFECDGGKLVVALVLVPPSQ